jgi:hypothetical protein
MKENSYRWTIFAILAVSLADAQPTRQFWLDAPPQNWNQAGAAIPRAGPKIVFPTECANETRAARTREEMFVERAGWRIPSWDAAPTPSDKIIIVMGMASADEKCRADRFQYFVYVNGMFAGTLAPLPMVARGDGAISRVTINSATNLTAEFVRYTVSDPLCCPSRVSRAMYEIAQPSRNPVVVLTSIATSLQ